MNAHPVLSQTAIANTTATAVYTVPSTVKGAIIKAITIANREASASITATLHIRLLGAAAATKQIILNAVPIANADSLTYDFPGDGLWLAATGILQVTTSNHASSVTVYGTEQVV